MITDWTIPGAHHQPIYGNTHVPEGDSNPIGVLVICHGFKGYKDYGFFPHLAHAAARANLIAVRFNFSHSGMTNQIESFERPELFEQDTWTRQVEDIQCVIRHHADAPAVPIVLMGHSRGGISSLLAAGQLSNPLAGVAVVAAPHEGCNLDEEQRRLLHAQGRLATPSARTGQVLYVGSPWLEEIERNPESCDPILAVQKISSPVLLVYGDEDATVPITSMKHLEAAARTVETVVVPEASHTFNCPNPLPLDQAPPPQTQEMIDAVLAFAVRCAKTVVG